MSNGATNPAFSPDNCHDILLRERTPLLRYSEGRDLDTWRSQVRSKLTELLGDMPEHVPLNLRVEWAQLGSSAAGCTQ